MELANQAMLEALKSSLKRQNLRMVAQEEEEEEGVGTTLRDPVRQMEEESDTLIPSRKIPVRRSRTSRKSVWIRSFPRHRKRSTT